ncbi:o-succinylbenzoate synthase [Paramixta manurensis]|uniref:o-succinylbenzoate synthase n=1 Tax=Paramixta manurensis TaxID=2740817 RepID=A0A6M8ULY5_9GAMM|nr:o-succinylbenzoate synthase [Erwiniaceae bacterium PD-1]
MRQATLWRYAIPMETGVVLREARLHQREGLLVELRVGDRHGWGEIAPLPGFSREDLCSARQDARDWLSLWCKGGTPNDSGLPSVAFGLSCALAELEQTLPQAGSWHSAALCTGDPDELFERLQALPQPVAKMKVGQYEAARDGMLAGLLLEALPDLRLRLDANRRWTPEKALQFARYIAPTLRSRIDFIEEPCQCPDDSRQFADETGITIAWDESLREEPFCLQAQPGVAAIVIKPTLTGSLTRIKQQIEAARQYGVRTIISSALESSLGLTQLARLAHWLTADEVPGLDTLNLMQYQLLRAWPGSPLPLKDKEWLTREWQS